MLSQVICWAVKDMCLLYWRTGMIDIEPLPWLAPSKEGRR